MRFWLAMHGYQPCNRQTQSPQFGSTCGAVHIYKSILWSDRINCQERERYTSVNKICEKVQDPHTIYKNSAQQQNPKDMHFPRTQPSLFHTKYISIYIYIYIYISVIYIFFDSCEKIHTNFISITCLKLDLQQFPLYLIMKQ